MSRTPLTNADEAVDAVDASALPAGQVTSPPLVRKSGIYGPGELASIIANTSTKTFVRTEHEVRFVHTAHEASAGHAPSVLTTAYVNIGMPVTDLGVPPSTPCPVHVTVDAALSIMSAADLVAMIISGLGMSPADHASGHVNPMCRLSVEDAAAWSGRIQAMCLGAFTPLAWWRDNEGRELTLDCMSFFLALGHMQRISTGHDGSHTLPDSCRTPARAYMESLPGYVPGTGSQHSSTKDQHEMAMALAVMPLRRLEMGQLANPGLGQAMLDGKVDWFTL